MLVAIYWEIGFCGEFESEKKFKECSRTLWEIREYSPVELLGLSRKRPQLSFKTISVENETKFSTVPSTKGDFVNELLTG